MKTKKRKNKTKFKKKKRRKKRAHLLTVGMNIDAQFGNIIDRPQCSEKTESVAMLEQDPFVSIKSISNNGRGSTIARERKCRVNRKRVIAEDEFCRQRPNERKRLMGLWLWLWDSGPKSLRNKECRAKEEQCLKNTR